MLNKVLLTPVDELVDIVRTNPNCSVAFIRNKLKLPMADIEKWIVILDEYDIIKVDYKGFEGYVRISEHVKEKEREGKLDIEKLKSVYIEKSKEKEYSFEKMQKLWPLFLKEYEEDIKTLFVDKAKENGFSKDRIDKAWIKYRGGLQTL